MCCDILNDSQAIKKLLQQQQQLLLIFSRRRYTNRGSASIGLGNSVTMTINTLPQQRQQLLTLRQHMQEPGHHDGASQQEHPAAAAATAAAVERGKREKDTRFSQPTSLITPDVCSRCRNLEQCMFRYGQLVYDGASHQEPAAAAAAVDVCSKQADGGQASGPACSKCPGAEPQGFQIALCQEGNPSLSVTWGWWVNVCSSKFCQGQGHTSNLP